MKLGIKPVLVTNNEEIFLKKNKYCKIFDKEKELVKKLNFESRNIAIIFENQEISNFYISKVGSDEDINFSKLLMDPKYKNQKNRRNITGRTSIHIKPLNLDEAKIIISDGEEEEDEDLNEKEQNSETTSTNSKEEELINTPNSDIEITFIKDEDVDLSFENEEGDIMNQQKETERLKTKLEFIDVVVNSNSKEKLKKNRNYSIINEKKESKKPKSSFLNVDRDYSSLYVVPSSSPITSPRIKILSKSKSQRNNVEKISDLTQTKNLKNLMNKTTIGQKLIKKISSKSDKNLKRKKKELFEFSDVFEQPYFQYFKMFLISEYSIENALFIESVKIYQNLIEKEEKRKQAKLIYEEYFEEDSFKELNISEKLKIQISLNIKIGKLKDNLFDDVVSELKSGLLQDSYTRFIRTNYFDEMFNE